MMNRVHFLVELLGERRTEHYLIKAHFSCVLCSLRRCVWSVLRSIAFVLNTEGTLGGAHHTWSLVLFFTDCGHRFGSFDALDCPSLSSDWLINYLTLADCNSPARGQKQEISEK